MLHDLQLCYCDHDCHYSGDDVNIFSIAKMIYIYAVCTYGAMSRRRLKLFFRRNIIGQLPAFNNLIEDVDSSDNTSFNNLISQFSNILRDAGNPLFLKNSTINRGFNCKHSNTCKWFDEDCKNAKHLYKEALFDFNCNKSIVNRTALANLKSTYKRLIKNKNVDIN